MATVFFKSDIRKLNEIKMKYVRLSSKKRSNCFKMKYFMQLIPEFCFRFAAWQVAYFKCCKNSETPYHLSAPFRNKPAFMFSLKAHNSGSYCGNKIVEEGEDCDCGRPEECFEVDKCCVPTIDALNIGGMGRDGRGTRRKVT